MLGERLPCIAAVTGDDVDNALWYTSFKQKFRRAQDGERGVLGRLDHGGAAGCEGWPENPPLTHERPVPRDDSADDAYWRLAL